MNPSKVTIQILVILTIGISLMFFIGEQERNILSEETREDQISGGTEREGQVIEGAFDEEYYKALEKQRK